MWPAGRRLLLLPLLLLLRLPAAAAATAAAAPPAFDWETITPARDLVYHDCYGAFKCARLVLPLDWTDPSDNRTVAIALIKLPALVPDTDPTFGGSIFTNPGGPGGSGVALVLSLGRRLRRIADKPGRRHYEIVSFDPRGMANSRPLADCFPADALARDAFQLEARGNGAFDDSSRAVPYMLGLFRGLGRRCLDAERLGLNGGEIMGYLSTPSVARDMVEMIDQIDALRARERERERERERRPLELRRRSIGAGPVGGAEVETGPVAATGRERGNTDGHGDTDGHGHGDVARLQYIGFSYGTILGNYFASLFPERIGRIVLDGVDNAVDYSTGPGWLTNTVDADEIVANFFSGCHDAGPAACALARASDASVTDLRARVRAWINHIDECPPTGLSVSGAVVVITPRDVDDLMGNAIYDPIVEFRPLAQALDAAMLGNTTAFVDLLTRKGFVPNLDASCALDNSPRPDRLLARPEGTFAVLCTDGDNIHGKDVAWWRRYVEEQVHTSYVLGSSWASIRMSCSAWPYRTNWSFKGPFTTPPAQSRRGRPVRGKPAAPLLFLSNRLDPVTPLSAARAMAADHPGAGLVIQEAMGHSALVTGDSGCTTSLVADYLESGVVPPREVTCAAECGPWDDACTVSPFSNSLRAPNFPHRRRLPLGVE